ncbi:MAG: protein kinase [Anaerolineae bacterium]
MSDLVGQTIGQYTIIRLIGEGGMGTVYEAVHAPLDRTVALKVMHSDLGKDETFVKRFMQEARSAARLEHPNIVPIYDTGEVEGLYYIAMKFLEGRTLDKMIGEEGPLGLRKAFRILDQLGSALDYAHGQGVIHRDIKPTNIMIGESDQVTVMDFGIAKALESQAILTQVGVAMGTPEYMSPEQLQAQEVDARSDVYSLGIVTYEMLAGKLPFRAPTPIAMALQQVQKEPPSLAEARPDLPPAVVEIVSKALSKEPEARYQSAGEMARALQAASEKVVAEERREKKLASLYAQVQELLEAENWSNAIARCGDIIGIDPTYRDVDALLGKAKEGLARQREREEREERVAALYEDAMAAMNATRWQEAHELFKQVQAVAPDYRATRKLMATAEEELARVTAEARRPEEVERELAAARVPAEAPAIPKPARPAGLSRRALGVAAVALLLLLGLWLLIHWIPGAPRAAPEPCYNASECTAIGVEYKHAGDYDIAIEYLNKALEFDPRYGDAYLGLGYAYWGKDDVDQAIHSFEMCLEICDNEDLRAEAEEQIKDLTGQ